MKTLKTIVAFLLLTNCIYSQQIKMDNKKEIKQMLNTFMECLIKKDSVKFYNLFHTENISWIGVTHEKSYADEIKKDSYAKNNFSATYKQFYRNFFKSEIEEKFYNVQIIEDGYIASVTFDYNFWYKNKKLNWGKESWGLI